MTPQELHAAVDERRQALNLPWWRIAIQLESSVEQVRGMKSRNHASKPLRARVETWLGDQS